MTVPVVDNDALLARYTRQCADLVYRANCLVGCAISSTSRMTCTSVE
jgi:hypothetical protein